MSNINNSAAINMAATFQALGNPHRLGIFLRLAECCQPGVACGPGGETTCVGEIGKELNLSPSTVSHHLKELRRAGLIHMVRTGQTVECWVEPGTLEALSRFFREIAPGCCA